VPGGLPSEISAAIARFRFRTARGEERLWKVWWPAGIPVAGLTAGLVILAEDMRAAGDDGWGDTLDVVRLLVYFTWFRPCWRCSRNVGHAPWTWLARTGLVTGLILSAMF
jgi:hypothetical protein